MNSRYIKIIAIITMTFDHVGFLLLEADSALYNIFRIIGRIAMPLFCLLIAYGVTKTRCKWKYFLRLFAFAIAVQAFFNLYMEHNLFAIYNWNVFFTLAFGIAAAGLIDLAFKIFHDKSEMPLGRGLGMTICFLSALGIVVAAEVLPIDYGSAGVLLVVLFYMALRHSIAALKITAAVSLMIFNLVLLYISGWELQWFAFLAFPFILVFIDKKLKISKVEKYAFYLYYPLHFAMLYLIGLAFF